MPRNVAASVENNFTRGLVTEASGLNFPENACTATYDCHFDLTGNVSRRLGFDFESSHDTKTIDRAGAAINTYLWRNVAGDGNVSLWVVQVGETLHFWSVGGSSSITNGELATTVDLTDFQPAGAPSPKAIECQFSSGNGYLFVTHPTLESFYVSYDTSTETATATEITLEMRDFGVGVSEVVDVDNRPAALTAAHKYNLANQGWGFSSYTVETSSTSFTPSTGSKAFTVTGSGPWAAGDIVYIWSKSTTQGSDPDFHFMQGTVTSYVGTTLTVNVTSFGPDTSGAAKTDWQIASGPDQISIWNDVMGNYPSNADVWWNFKDANDQFNPRKTGANIDRGNAHAPQGHYILNVYDQDRSDVSGIAGLTAVTTSYFRVATSAFHAGRVFYSGITYQNRSSDIYFTQILHPGETDDFGKCYQAADPTSELVFDLQPNDGGVISIPEAGQILKLWAMQGGLTIFATNGIWQITGSAGIGFTANDYTVRNISTIKCIGATSFVDVGGFPAFWAAEGIYILTPDQAGGVNIKTLTDETILTFYNSIPSSSKRQARGFFDLISKKVQWLFKSTEASTPEEICEYDRILVWNARTAAFNPWTVSASDVKMHAILVPDSTGSALTEVTVVDDAADTVQDDAGNDVVRYSVGSAVSSPTFKYLVSYDDGAGSYTFTVAEELDEDYVDWFTYDSVGVDYTSYFISGYKVHGQGQRKFQSNYVYIFSGEIPSQYNFQALWDYANTGDSGDWSSQTHQTVAVSDTQYDIKRNRLKVRGSGLALQFKVYSEPGEPFNIVGWSVWETGNASI